MFYPASRQATCVTYVLGTICYLCLRSGQINDLNPRGQFLWAMVGNECYKRAAIMPLNLYRRQFRTPGKCTAGYEPDFRNYEADELRRGWKKCRCPIYAAGTLGRKFNRKNTKKITWAEAKAVVAQWEAAGKWNDEEARAFPS